MKEEHIVLSKITSLTPLKNPFTLTSQDRKSQNFARTIHLEHYLRVNDVHFEGVVQKLEFLLGGKAQHYLENGRHVVDIVCADNSDLSFFLGKIPKADKEAYKIKDLG